MMKNIFNIVCIVLFTNILMQSCIRDFEMSNEEVIQQNKRFAMFNKNTKEAQKNKGNFNVLVYQKSFKDLYFRYYQLNPDKSLDFGNKAIALPDFHYASQVLAKDGSNTVLFPIIQNDNVIDILCATINKEENYLQF